MNEQNVTAGFNAPASLVQAKISEGKAKTEMPVWKVLLLGIFAGMFIAFGASSSSLAIHAIENPGVAKLIAGLIFPVGLMMIVFVGGELFTGDCMMLMGNLHKKYNALSMIRVLVLVYLSNLVGSVIIAALVYFSGQLDLSLIHISSISRSMQSTIRTLLLAFLQSRSARKVKPSPTGIKRIIQKN